MPDTSVLRRLPLVAFRTSAPQAGQPGGQAKTRPSWWPAWSVPAALRTVRAVLLIPALFALAYEGIGNLQIALFTAFGGFASLVVASFGGSRRDKAVAHLGLALTGSLGLIIGTAVNGIEWLAVLVTIPVAFGIFFAGVAGPNAASGVIAALFPFVLSVATPGTVSMIPDRLAGWWLASVAATAAVLVLSPPSPGDRLRAAAVKSAQTLAAVLEAVAGGTATMGDHEACRAAKEELISAFDSTPYRPTGLATADQAMASVVQYLEWCTALIADATGGHPNLDQAAQSDRDLLAETAVVLRQIGGLLADRDGTAPLPEVDELERRRAVSAAHHRSAAAGDDYDSVQAAARYAFHAQTISLAVRGLSADALIATRRADPATVAARRRGWYGAQPDDGQAERRAAALSGAARVLSRHASIRSVWFQNGLRGSLALAAAVLVADLSGVQHGFWVVLGTLSVLRTSAASTESTALRGLAGTVIGFVIGALLLLGIGTSTPALWAALPIAIAVAAYAPGTLPFTFGQAAFTVVIVVLFNLLQPVGWKVGLLRIQDVAIGCLVSLVVGVLFWPRGAAGVVGDDLADAFRVGAAYLRQSVDWALGTRTEPPDEGPEAVTAALRLDEALRGFLAEQGAKHLSKPDLWMLITATMRLRLTAYSLAGLQAPMHAGHRHRGLGHARRVLSEATTELTAFYERIAVLVGRPAAGSVLPPASVPAFGGLRGMIVTAGSSTEGVAAISEVGAALGATAAGDPAEADGSGDSSSASEDRNGDEDGDDVVRIVMSRHHPHLLWVEEHLQHLSEHAQAITGPATHVAEQRRQPWWR